MKRPHAPHGYPAAVETRRPSIPRRLAVLARVLRPRLAVSLGGSPAQWSVLHPYEPVQTSLCSRPTPAAVGTRRVSPCFFKLLWSGISTLVSATPCRADPERTLERCPRPL